MVVVRSVFKAALSLRMVLRLRCQLQQGDDRCKPGSSSKSRRVKGSEQSGPGSDHPSLSPCRYLCEGDSSAHSACLLVNLMKQSTKRIAVIGAGPGGLAALRILSETPSFESGEWTITAFEARDNVGGVWYVFNIESYLFMNMASLILILVHDQEPR
jgi:hypothetical protein